MRYPNLIEVDKDFIIIKYANGIKIKKPTAKSTEMLSAKAYSEEQTVSEIFNLPLNIIFLNRDSVIQNINQNNAATFGCSSTRQALGKTIHSTYKKEAANFSINHDLEVVRSGKMIIREEDCQRIDDIAFQAITAKFPWYNDNDEIVGVLGCSIPIGLQGTCNIHDALLSFMKLKLFATDINTATSFLPGRIIDGVYLSHRETECVYHLIYGRTAKMIGRALNLSPRTVECHLKNAKIKLQVSSKSELIDKALNSWYQKQSI